MASLHLAGALGGATKGLSNFISNEAKAERDMALEELRASNDRANAEFEHSNSMELERLRQAGDLATKAVDRAYGGGTADLPADAQMIEYLKDNGMDHGPAQDLVMSSVGTSPDQFRRDLLAGIVEGNPYLLDDQDALNEKLKSLDSLTANLYGSTAQPGQQQPPPAPNPSAGGRGQSWDSLSRSQQNRILERVESGGATPADLDMQFGDGTAARLGLDGSSQPRDTSPQTAPNEVGAPGPQASAPQPAPSQAQEPPGLLERLAQGLQRAPGQPSSFTPRGGYSSRAPSLRDSWRAVASAAGDAKDFISSAIDDRRNHQQEAQARLAAQYNYSLRDARDRNSQQQDDIASGPPQSLQAQEDKAYEQQRAQAAADRQRRMAERSADNQQDLITRFLQIRRAGEVPIEDMPPDVLKAYAATLPDGHPVLAEIQSALQGNSVAQR